MHVRVSLSWSCLDTRAICFYQTSKIPSCFYLFLFNTSLDSFSFSYVMSTSSAILNSFSARPRRFAFQNLPKHPRALATLVTDLHMCITVLKAHKAPGHEAEPKGCMHENACVKICILLNPTSLKDKLTDSF